MLGVDLEQSESLNPDTPLYGYRLLQHPHCKAVIPVCALAETSEQWNIGELQEFIGLELPEDSQLHYYQALGRKDLLRKVASRLTTRFAEIAAGVGASPAAGRRRPGAESPPVAAGGHDRGAVMPPGGAIDVL